MNLKFEKDLVAELKQVYGKEILDIGTGSLHPVHTAYCKGLKSIGFDYDKFATELHFFKHSAARREDIEMTNLKTALEVPSHAASCTKSLGLTEKVFSQLSVSQLS